jgi:hypothetical protein
MRFSKRVCVQDFFYEIIQAVTASRTTVWKWNFATPNKAAPHT